jgi:3-hydroxy-9,10-secoandrosta-1,3,5(10)-triene-9,17-dione monooxygenase
MQREDALGRARDCGQALRDRAREAELLRRIPDETMAELHASGLFRLLQPSKYGGEEADPYLAMEVAMELAAACGSTGWVYSILGIHSWHLAHFPTETQDDVWGEKPTALIGSQYNPRGALTAADGGYLLSGTWPFSSGCDHVDWVLLGARAQLADGSAKHVCCLVPRSQLTIDDTWHVMGLKATGSKDVVVCDVFVPNHHMHDLSSGSSSNPSWTYQVAFLPVFTYSITAPLMGMVRGAYREYIAQSATRFRSVSGSKVADEQFSQIRIADAEVALTAAEQLMRTDFADMATVAEHGDPTPFPLRLRARRNQVHCARLAIGAVDQVFTNAGGSAIYDHNPIQRMWRDAHAAQVHTANTAEPILSLFGKHELGLSVDEATV